MSEVRTFLACSGCGWQSEPQRGLGVSGGPLPGHIACPKCGAFGTLEARQAAPPADLALPPAFFPVSAELDALRRKANEVREGMELHGLNELAGLRLAQTPLSPGFSMGIRFTQ